MELVCTNCSRGTLLTISGPCAECGFGTYANFQLCQACAMRADECQQCRKKLNAGFSTAEIEAVSKAAAERAATIQAIEHSYHQVVDPIKDAVEAFKKADADAYDELRQATTESMSTYDKAVEVLRAAHARRQDVEAAQKAYDEASAAAREARQQADCVMKTRREAIDAQWGKERNIFDEATSARQKNTWRAQRRFEAFVNLVLGRRQLEMKYKAELEKIDR